MHSRCGAFHVFKLVDALDLLFFFPDAELLTFRTFTESISCIKTNSSLQHSVAYSPRSVTVSPVLISPSQREENNTV